MVKLLPQASNTSRFIIRENWPLKSSKCIIPYKITNGEKKGHISNSYQPLLKFIQMKNSKHATDTTFEENQDFKNRKLKESGLAQRGRTHQANLGVMGCDLVAWITSQM